MSSMKWVSDVRRARWVAPLALVLLGCHNWPTRQLNEIGAGQTVRVVTDDGRRRAMLEGATVVDDSVVGRLAALDTLGRHQWAPLGSATGERTAIAVSAITRVERRELDKRRSVSAFVYLIPFAVLLAAFASMTAPPG